MGPAVGTCTRREKVTTPPTGVRVTCPPASLRRRVVVRDPPYATHRMGIAVGGAAAGVVATGVVPVDVGGTTGAGRRYDNRHAMERPWRSTVPCPSSGAGAAAPPPGMPAATPTASAAPSRAVRRLGVRAAMRPPFVSRAG